MMRFQSTVASTSRHVLCSLKELQAHKGRAIKFPLPTAQTTTPETSIKRHERRDAILTGFAFFCDQSQRPRAYINRCPHALLELDLDDSDFFCEGFIQCKAHGAFFDPMTGICLRGPPVKSRNNSLPQKDVGELHELNVQVENDQVVLLLDEAQIKPRKKSIETEAPFRSSSAELQAYRQQKQQQLAEVLASRSDEVSAIEKMLHEKAMTRIQIYKQRDQGRDKTK